MDAKELKALIKQLKASGVTHYKTKELELNLGEPKPKRSRKKPIPIEVEKETEADPIPHIVQELSSIMQLSNEQLVDRMFPLPKEEQDEETIQ